MTKFAICNEMFDGWDHASAVECAAELGYTGLEVAPFTLGERAGEVSQQQRREFRSLVDSNGMQIIGLHWLLARTQGFHLTINDKGVRERTVDYFVDLANLCSELGGSLMVLGSPQQRSFESPVTDVDALKYTVDILERLVPVLESNQIVLALEPLGPEETNFIQTAAEAQQICDAVGSPWVRLHLDVKAMSTESDPIEKIILDQAANIAHFHANDPNRLGPGMGEVEFFPIFKALQEIEYSGWLSVEVFDFSLGPRRIAGESIEYMKRVFGELE